MTTRRKWYRLHWGTWLALMVVGESQKGQALRSGGRLADIAPTILTMLDLDPPPEMTGTSLLEPQPAATPRP